MKKYILLILVILWMGVIFYFSNMVSYKSDETSDEVIDSTVLKVSKFFKKDLTKEQENNIYRYSVYPVRKYAHVFEFFVLYVLVFLSNSEILSSSFNNSYILDDSLSSLHITAIFLYLSLNRLISSIN